MPIDFEEYFIFYELDQMSRYLDMVERSITQEFEKLEKEHEEDMEREIEEDIDDDYTDAMIDKYQDKYMEIGRDFPRLIFGSFIIAWYSFVEQKMLDICESRKLRISISAKENVNLGKGISKARKFLFESAGCRIDDKHWQELVNIQHLRNFIVHKGYQIPSSYVVEPEKPFVVYEAHTTIPTYLHIEESLYRYLRKYSMIYELSWAQIEISPTQGYCEHLVEFGKEYFKGLFDNLRKGKKQE